MSGSNPLASNPYVHPPFRSKAERDFMRVTYTDGRPVRRHDVVMDGRGRRLTVIGIDSRRGRAMAVDADYRMVGIDPLEVELVNHDE